jgi:hypothetical protein
MKKLRADGIRLTRETLYGLDSQVLQHLQGGKTITAPVSWPACTSGCPSAGSVC